MGVVDYGGANHALFNAVDILGFDYFISDNKKSLDDAEKIITWSRRPQTLSQQLKNEA